MAARVRSTILLLLLAALAANGNLVNGAVHCPEQFIPLGNFCYHFTTIEEDWVGARGVCEGIGIFQQEKIILGVLDYGLSLTDNQLLLSEISSKGSNYWLGGSLDGELWRWIDHSNREIDLHANYWDKTEPSTSNGDCLMITKGSHRSYVKGADCSQRANVICQIIPEEIGFRSIGNDVFYFSSENNLAPMSSWQDARNSCLSLQPPHKFDHFDLAVLGLNQELDQDLLQFIAQQGMEVWLGGQHNATNAAYDDLSSTWIDGRSMEDDSYFWHHDHGTSDVNTYNHNYYAYAQVMSVNGHARATLRLENSSNKRNFVCQAYKTSNQ